MDPQTIAQFKTVGGATVDITTRSGYYDIDFSTEHHVICTGCAETHTVTWGFDAYHDEFGTGPQPSFDETGELSLPAARDWAQAHAETCRAMPTA